MESILSTLPQRHHDVPIPTDLSDVYRELSSLLRHLSESTPPTNVSVSQSETPAAWLYDKCSAIPSPLGPLQFTLATLAALQGSNKEQGLFDLFGEQDVELLFEIMGRESEFREVTEQDIRAVAREEVLDAAMSTALCPDDSGAEEHFYNLRNEAYELTNLLVTVRQDLPSSSVGPAGSGTHTVTRKSDKEAEKIYKKAVKQAAIAIEKARDAGALTSGDVTILTAMKDGIELDFSQLDEFKQQWQNQGLDGMDERQIEMMKADLLPEGTKEYDSSFKRGLPRGAIREIKEGYEQVIIPAPVLDTSKLPERIVLEDVLGVEERQAFAGTTSLNPMQSAVFGAAYQTRENLLICAPTGAGKTNVAMLTVVSHLRDVGLIGTSYYDNDSNVTTGKKIIYIAPMKALAQEVVEKFSSKLKPLGIIVKELTGDMQLSRAEAEAAHILVTTPEKWDVVTRKGGDGTLGSTCGLLIIDEVHLLADERGAVIESVVARLHRWVESSQRQVRLVGLSATLPNYEDVATFLRVDKSKGLYFFGPEHRPVPLQQTFIGVTSNTRDRFQREKKMDDVCYEVVSDALRDGHQVMVFVHSRKGTGMTAKALAERAAMDCELERLFICDEDNEVRSKYNERAEKSRNRELTEHFRNGMGIHHAGMLRNDRKLSEQMFNDGAIKVLCCTATLAWGINLPAHTVIIKGTDVYMPEKGKNVDLSILDVQQIFGRAGRPQFDTSGDATLITSYDAMARYLDKLVRATPIESNFIKQLPDHLNAEVVAGSVTNIQEAIEWIRYTYLHVRMCRNPLAYGISPVQIESDPSLRNRSRELATEAARLLDERKMIRYNPDSGNLAVTNLGRVASHFYIRNESIATFNELIDKNVSPNDADVLHVMCCADEFENIRVRPEELDEIDRIKKESCPIKTIAPVEDYSGKCNVLLQAYITKARITSFTLISDTNYIASNASRVARALFEMCLKNGKASAALKFIRLAKSVDHRFWWFQSPLRHFEHELKKNVFVQLEDSKKRVISEDSSSTFQRALSLLDMEPDEVGQLCHCFRDGGLIQKHVRFLPNVEISCTVHPITKGTLRFSIQIDPVFTWSPRYHGGAEGFWLWVEDNENNRTYHNEYILFSRRNHPESTTLELIIPVLEPLPTQYFIRVVSDNWVGCESLVPVSFRHVLLDGLSSPTFFTSLFDLTPLPIQALSDPQYAQLYSKRFEVFNPIQTQLFHILFHTDVPVLLGAPTGSGKTTVAELALLRMKRETPQAKCVYIAPLKSLARERLKEWSKRLGAPPLNWKVLELSGDTSHDSFALNKSDILICTPEKWDLISRGWRGISKDFNSSSATNGKQFVRQIGLLIIDEIHLLGEERGAVLEAIVSRTRFISQYVNAERQQKSNQNITPVMTRIMGLSTALANPYDLADWIGIDVEGHGVDAKKGLYNFRPSVRPVPMVVHIQGYPGRHYCPRMATMNKPCYAAIKDLSPTKPSMIFVASRRQTRLTALDLISHAAAEENPKLFLHCDYDYIDAIAESLNDKVLAHTVTFGVGLHHAGLTSRDREIVEKLYLEGQIQVLIATATLAWGVNLPAHLVIVKGTEFFDGKLSRYVDYPVTDILQMMGRAGRPQFDKEGVAVIMCEESKKNFLKKFLYEPFPVESCLEGRMCEIINAEISIGSISCLSDALGYLNYSFFSRRVKINPSYYGARSSSEEDIDDFYLQVVKDTMSKLQDEECIAVDETEGTDSLVVPTPLGHACSNFYLLHQTPLQMKKGTNGLKKILSQHASNENNGQVLSLCDFIGADNVTRQVICIRRIDANTPIHMYAVAKILFELSFTHEYNELPVRHNEEELNLELSKSLPWGHDLSKVSFWINKKKNQGNLLDIMLDPHTKCFLLLQAFIFKSKLPISDYINDMRSVVDQIPRLLAAMEYIAQEDKGSAGSFEMFLAFSVVRRIFQTGVMSPHAAGKVVYPATFGRVKVNRKIEKGSTRHVGCVEIEYKVERSVIKTFLSSKKGNNAGKDQSMSVTLILGTCKGGYLLQMSSFAIPQNQREQTWKKTIHLDFDWNLADVNGGDEKGVVLRVMHEFVHSADLELTIPLNQPE